MNKGLKKFIGVIIVLIAVCAILFFINQGGTYKKILKDTVIITDGKIENENLIDEFIKETSGGVSKKLNLIVKENNIEKNIELTFVPSEMGGREATLGYVPETKEDYFKFYGYYILSINGEEKTKNDALRWIIKRINQNGKLTLSLNNIIHTSEFTNICEYDLEGSNYVQKFKINYNQRKDLEIKTIIDKNTSDQYEYSVYTFGGDVTITIDGDKVYSIEDALSQNVISGEDILEQAKIDEKYGLCEEGCYMDGGSTEYLYSNYTILKCNTLNENKDLYIGMSGQILSQINKIAK